ncbi:MAG: copper resistance protein CopA [Sulfurovum sp. 39-42-12]|nr:MAG: copper resistance protein CopA [Sulfurovum sp. 35-42-20]OYZ23501.1 MAG: copper resistance protein CopA [Sulfurovum sp. 16-42-52]OYZ47661.1 MAG: copper resistance protein CopA [Sulfurovum sp. 24-42-9]OZA43064.1 MAG: copper resistance protein CopA [Sulfurovum sp. 17-42-90]OZA61235.1 MAG: copper resistance protein CopA [Sulfurovum sp. 39-42-12]
MQRRTFVKGIAAASIMGMTTTNIEAKPTRENINNSNVLTGNEFFLDIDYTPVNITGKNAIATTVNGQIAGPTLVWNEGETVTLHVTNHLKKTSSIHWHGIILPTGMDGVPGLSFDGIAPGETFTYKFKVQQHGTYWYHSHSGFQEQTGVYGAIVIMPKKKEPFYYDKDYVVQLSDWSDEEPMEIYKKLKQMSGYYNFSQRTVGTFLDEVKEKGLSSAFSDRKMWNQMRMSDRDISDVTGYTYTFLMNGKNPATQFKALFKKGEKIRLRFVNSAAMTFFDVRIPGLKMTVVAADGNHVKPVSIDEFRIGVAETYDVIVQPTDNKAYAIFAQGIDRSGYAMGSLTPNVSMLASAPRMDPVPVLTHTDMGMNMSEMDQGGGMKCSSGMEMPSKKSMKKDKYADMESQKYPITQLPMKRGLNTDMMAMSPKYRLDDPGVGLRNNGRMVLTYADLKNIYSTSKDRKPDREIILHLTGNMERYMWSINGIKYADSKPLEFHYGERIRITFINDTMMNHPMHLHGMWSDLETGDDNHLVRKHTIIVQPGAKISYRVTVNAKGNWAYHCHMLYHMAGMFRKVVVA